MADVLFHTSRDKHKHKGVTCISKLRSNVEYLSTPHDTHTTQVVDTSLYTSHITTTTTTTYAQHTNTVRHTNITQHTSYHTHTPPHTPHTHTHTHLHLRVVKEGGVDVEEDRHVHLFVRLQPLLLEAKALDLIKVHA